MSRQAPPTLIAASARLRQTWHGAHLLADPVEENPDVLSKSQLLSPVPDPQNSTRTETKTASIRDVVEVSDRGPEVVNISDPNCQCPIY